jgi:hypothetical protein
LKPHSPAIGAGADLYSPETHLYIQAGYTHIFYYLQNHPYYAADVTATVGGGHSFYGIEAFVSGGVCALIHPDFIEGYNGYNKMNLEVLAADFSLCVQETISFDKLPGYSVGVRFEQQITLESFIFSTIFFWGIKHWED